MTQVLDYSKVCGACSTPLTSPPRDGPGSMCAYLHTRQGRREFEATLKRNRKRQAKVDMTPTVTPPADDTTETPDGVTSERDTTTNGTTEDEGVTSDEDDTTETKQQRHYRLNKAKINQQRKDRRNGLST